jgi:hypothetical protein
MGVGLKNWGERTMSDEVELTELRRRELFAALVTAQDEGLSVRDSRAAIARRFTVDVQTVAEVEDEGLDGRWPPLGNG